MAITLYVLVLLHVLEHAVGHCLVSLSHLVQGVVVAVLNGIGHECRTATDILKRVLEHQIAMNKFNKLLIFKFRIQDMAFSFKHLPRVFHICRRQRLPQHLVGVRHHLPVARRRPVAHHPLAVSSLVRPVPRNVLIRLDGNSIRWSLVLLSYKLPSEPKSVRVVLLLLLLLLLVLLHNVRII